MSDSSILANTRLKLGQVFHQLRDLESSEFAYPDAREAVQKLQSLFKDDLALLDSLPVASSDAKLVESTCSEVNHQISRYLPIFGFILRSSNVRNSFEVYYPVLQICKTIVHPDVKLIYSSEWRYSPHTYPLIFDDLPGFVFVGLPAHESGNALVIPLVGHEIGHSVWQFHKIDGAVKNGIIDSLVDYYITNAAQIFGPNPKFPVTRDNLLNVLFFSSTFGQSQTLALAQAQEAFCDVIGVALFGRAYLSAFKYLSAPIQAPRSPNYPPLDKRVRCIVTAAEKFGHTVAADFTNGFLERPTVLEPIAQAVLDAADHAVSAHFEKISDAAADVCKKFKSTGPTAAGVKRATSSMKRGRPSSGQETMAEIVQAGWDLLQDKTFRSEVDSVTRANAINELVLKGIEVGEYLDRMRD